STIPVGIVSVEPCTTVPCELRRGTRTSFRIQFQPDETMGSVGQVEVYGVVGGVAVPFTLDTPKMCGNVQPHCPFRAGAWYSYKKSILIASTHS
ncbi:hypothetical protein X801_08580, partial [Opisthorchis viverrini]